MTHPLLTTTTVDEAPADFLHRVGTVFTVFDQQDSGNISYGVTADGQRYFVKTTGRPDNVSHTAHPIPERGALLRNAARVAAIEHPTRPTLHHVIESPAGPILVYAWATGELLHADGVLNRYRRLPATVITGHLLEIYDLHERLAAAGWIASDFYDGSLLHDFDTFRLTIMDLDLYHRGQFVNTMGRMFGSRRFMAPEEFELGATIDQRTNVYTLGRTAFVLLSDGSPDPAAFRGPRGLLDIAARATDPDRDRRFATVADFTTAWRTAAEQPKAA